MKYGLLLFLCLCLACTPTEESQDAPRTATLERHIIQSTSDGHYLSLWEKSHPKNKHAILLVHGRTWSALPDFDLQVEGEDLSLMDGLVEAGYNAYAIDLRGYGGTTRDSTGWATPNRSAMDIADALVWIHEQEGDMIRPHLFGWSMGSTLSQLTAQQRPELMASLTLFGYWKDSDQQFPAEPEAYPEPARVTNTAEAAASDFITPGSISQNAIDAYVKAALEADPIRADLRRFDHYNALDPAKVTVPTLILQGEFDPIGPTEYQTKLFTRLGTSHKQWVVIKGGDHAAFMETPRALFIHSLVNFLDGICIDLECP